MPAESFTAAAAQIAPVYHDKEETIDKTCRYIERAGDAGVDIVVFPEAHVPGYPYWRGSVSIPRWTDLMVELQKRSLHVEDEAMDVLGDAIDKANCHVVLGANELDDRRGSETLYNTMFYFDAMGHYTRWDAVSLTVSGTELSPFDAGQTSNGPAQEDTLSAATAQELAETYDVPVDVIEAVATEITSQKPT